MVLIDSPAAGIPLLRITLEQLSRTCIRNFSTTTCFDFMSLWWPLLRRVFRCVGGRSWTHVATHCLADAVELCTGCLEDRVHDHRLDRIQRTHPLFLRRAWCVCDVPLVGRCWRNVIIRGAKQTVPYTPPTPIGSVESWVGSFLRRNRRKWSYPLAVCEATSPGVTDWASLSFTIVGHFIHIISKQDKKKQVSTQHTLQ